jgi:hypothetical protein
MDTAYTRCEFLDDDLKPVIYKYARKKIFISETLRVFVKNGFKTDEEIRHENEVLSIAKQLKLTRIALAFTFAGLLISIFMPIIVISGVDIKNDRIVTELNQKTIDATQKAFEAGINPAIQELVSIQGKLTVLSNSILQAAETSSSNDQKSYEFVYRKLDTIIESSNRTEKALTGSHNKKIQPTAKSGG